MTTMSRPVDERLPLYARLRDELAARIAASEWPPGFAIPAEQELATAYRVSVSTIRRAIEQLVAEGLLERKQGSGTYVRRPSFDGSLFRWFNFEDSAGGGRIVPESRLLRRSVVTAPEKVAAQLQLGPERKAVRVLRLRLWQGQTIVTEDLYLPYPRYERFIELSEQDIGPLFYPVYERVFGDLVTAVTDEISVGRADRIRAKLLGIEVGAPVVHVDRLSLRRDGTVVDTRRAYGRADRFRYRVTLK